MYICSVPSDYEGDKVYSSLTLSLEKKEWHCEHAGHQYEYYLLRQQNLLPNSTDSSETSNFSNSNENSNENENEISNESKTSKMSSKSDEDFSSKFKPQIQKNIRHDDFYGLLGLGTVRYQATDEDIRKAYKKMSLIHHPDKNGGDDTMFKQIKDAYETLSNPSKRKQYDSTDDCDDRLPPEKNYDEKEFYAVFGSYFKKNERWSVNKNVPNFGDEKTNINDVFKFYNFWNAFRSWREPPLDEMYNLEEATCREERRWMMKENEKKLQKKKKEESQRIKRLVDMAYKHDFRIIRHKLKEKEEKEKKQKEEEQRKIELEKWKEMERLKIEQERMRLEEEEKRREEELIQERKEKKELLIGLFQLQSYNETWQCAIKNVIIQLEDDELFTVASMQKQSQIEFLTKRVEKYVEKKEMENKQKMNRNVLNEWSSKDIELFKKGCQKYPSGTEGRYRRIAMYMKTKTEQEVIDYAKALNAKLHGNQGKQNAQSKGANSTGSNAGNSTTSGTTINQPSQDVLNWTKDQQIQLQNAIKQFNNYKGEDRWDKISALVKGKTKQQCIERVQYLKQLAAQKKQQQN